MSEALAPVDLVLLWHHHQPDYRDPADGRSVLPWARLHAGKDYLDMARHLERHPRVRATFNLVPSLVDQIEGAAGGAPDELFELLARPLESLSPGERAAVVWRCGHVPTRAVERWPALRALRQRVQTRDGNGVASEAGGVVSEAGGVASEAGAAADRDLLALQIWFLLAWVDPMFHGEPEAARALGDHPEWSPSHRDDLIGLHRRLAADVLPAYRALAERGQIELSTSPYYHPILPLLIDLASARRARPDLPVPAERVAAPEDARAQIVQALERHAAIFGCRPAGLWPSEGSVSPEAVELAAREGIRWMATDEGVLWASLGGPARDPGGLYRPWSYPTGHGDVALFFRDRVLSDRIGFVYQRWDPADAAADFVAHLRRVAREFAGDRPPVVSVILDGENCWEHYVDDGNPFLEALYGALSEADDIRTRTPSELLEEGLPTARLERLHSGSWIDADFHIWIGHPDKNRAWEAVARARQALVQAGATPDRAPAAWQALYRAEGSDWFWWFGDDHYTPDRPVFDRLFRELLSAAYEGAGLLAPPSLRLPIVRTIGRVGTDRVPIGFVTPTIDGRRTTFYEWHNAGRCVLDGGGSMHRAAGLVRELHYGFDASSFYLRLDFAAGAPPGDDLDLGLDVVEPRPLRLRIAGLGAGDRPILATGDGSEERRLEAAVCHVGALLELAVPFANLGWSPGERVALLVQAMRGGRALETYPGEDGLSFEVPRPEFEAELWSA